MKRPRTGDLKIRTPQRRRKPVEEDRNANHIQALFGRHQGQDVYVCGTGTSLIGFDWSCLRDHVTIALNEAVKVPGFKPTYHFFSDGNLIHPPKKHGKPNHLGDYGRIQYADETSVICQNPTRRTFLENTKQPVELKRRVYQFTITANLSICTPTDDHLYLNNTIATGAIMLAYKMGARRVFLLGVDGYKIKEGEGGAGKEVYYHDGTAKPPERRKVVNSTQLDGFVRIVQDRHQNWCKQMNDLRKWLDRQKAYMEDWPGSNVYQTSEHSPIECWQKISLKEALPWTSQSV